VKYLGVNMYNIETDFKKEGVCGLH